MLVPIRFSNCILWAPWMKHQGRHSRLLDPKIFTKFKSELFQNWLDFRPPELVFAPINLQKVPHFFSFDYLDVGLVYFYSHGAHEVAVLGWMIDSELEIEQVGPFLMVFLDQINKHWRNSPLNYFFNLFLRKITWNEPFLTASTLSPCFVIICFLTNSGPLNFFPERGQRYFSAANCCVFTYEKQN